MALLVYRRRLSCQILKSDRLLVKQKCEPNEQIERQKLFTIKLAENWQIYIPINQSKG